MSDKNPAEGKQLLYLDDLQVGQRFSGHPQQLDAEQIKQFARQFDPQPFHLDEEAAKHSVFGGLVASGWHTAAVSMRQLVEELPIAGGLIGAGGDIRWLLPVRPGDTLHVECEIVDVKISRSRPDRGIITLRGETRNQAGEIVQVLHAKLMVPRRPL